MWQLARSFRVQDIVAINVPAGESNVRSHSATNQHVTKKYLLILTPADYKILTQHVK